MDLSIFKKVGQIGFVVRDCDRTVRQLRMIMGIEPDETCETSELPGRKYFGEEDDFVAKCLEYRLDNIDLEFIQPLRGRNIWQEYLDEHGEGIHHIQFFVDDFHEAVEYMAGFGIPLAMEGPSVIPGAHWGYFDSVEQLGFYLEVFTYTYTEKK